MQAVIVADREDCDAASRRHRGLRVELFSNGRVRVEFCVAKADTPPMFARSSYAQSENLCYPNEGKALAATLAGPTWLSKLGGV
ncbi:hypothetical protein NITLEN_100009 [Nitrospira lenta]|uniref:Uncharacterized protein n=1 Tax=Nitrospira lenta TaxID=1436998 RepID=A0A330L2V7_9BACT|nr:hypothetical protein NITLEN_100009 [Nitrospira lenta]